MSEINKIRLYINSRIGCKIKFICYGNRNKKEKYFGKIIKVFPRIFLVELSNGNVKSISYFDVYTKNVRIFI